MRLGPARLNTRGQGITRFAKRRGGLLFCTRSILAEPDAGVAHALLEPACAEGGLGDGAEAALAARDVGAAGREVAGCARRARGLWCCDAGTQSSVAGKLSGA